MTEDEAKLKECRVGGFTKASADARLLRPCGSPVLTPLLEALRSATEGSLELDVLIWAEVGYDSPTTRSPERPMGDSANLADAMATFPGDFHGFAFCWNIPRLSTSLEAALALVSEKLPGAGWLCGANGQDEFMAELFRTKFISGVETRIAYATAPTAPLALLCALLTALAAEDQA